MAALHLNPMRKQLQQINGERITVEATVDCFSIKETRWAREETICLTHITNQEGKLLTDHLWWKRGKWAADLNIGDRIRLDARVKPYTKGYQGRLAYETGEAWTATDYRLSHPTNVEVVKSGPARDTICAHIQNGADIGELAEQYQLSRRALFMIADDLLQKHILKDLKVMAPEDVASKYGAKISFIDRIGRESINNRKDHQRAGRTHKEATEL